MSKISKTNELLLHPSNRDKYDSKSTESILSYAIQMEGMTFEAILYQNGMQEADIDYIRNKSVSNKGLLGILLEEAWFGYPANSKQGADFSDTGIELKSTPYEGDGNNIHPGETISLTQINYSLPQEPDFYQSHAWEKMQKILVVYYKRQKELAKQRHSKLFYSIDYVFMLQPDEKDLAIIEADYKLLIGYIMRGEAEKLSRTHGQYLGVAPKSSKKEYVKQYYGNHIPALKRGFVLKVPYLTYVLQRAAGITEDEGGTIIKNASELKNKTLIDIINERVQKFIGMDIKDIWNDVKRSDEGGLPSAKNEDAVISCRMLGVTNNRVDEFVKAGIIPKVIKFRTNKNDNQHFRLEDINLIELSNEETDDQASKFESDDYIRRGWESSKLFGYLADRQYLFMVFWDTDRGRVFKGCQLWGIPDNDLEVVHSAWIKTKKILRKGVQFSFNYDKNGKLSVSNNLPGLADNGIFHIRPHAHQAYYVINGESFGNGDLSDTDLLPDGNRMTKQAYWLNRSYIESQLKSDLVKKYE